MLWTIRRDQRGVSNIIVVVLGLVIIVIITSNVILWSYEMNQLDWEKMKEDITIVGVTRATDAWPYNASGYTLGGSTSWVSGSVSNLTSDDGVYMTFRSYYSGTDASDFVDETCDVHLPSAKGTHSNFTAQQYYDSYFDTLTEANTGGSTTYQIHPTDFTDVGWEWSNEPNAWDWNNATSATKDSGNIDNVIDWHTWNSTGQGIISQVDLRVRLDLTGLSDDYVIISWYVGATQGTGTYEINSGNQGTDIVVTFNDVTEPINGTWEWADIGNLEIRQVGTKVGGPDSITYAVDEVWGWVTAGSGSENYELDLEVQWTNVDYDETNEYLCIYGEIMGSENVTVDVWNGTAWNNVFDALSSGWNNVSVSSYLTSSNFTIRFKGGNETGDDTQDSWNIDVTMLHVWSDEYTLEVEFTGSSNTEDWSQLNWTVNSAWTIGSVNVTLQLYNYTLDGYPASGDGYIAYTSDNTPNTDENKSQTINVNPTHFRNATGYWKMKVKGVKATDTQFDFKADWIEFKVLKTGGTLFTFKNGGSLTSHLVSLWVNNSTHHERYDISILVNAGDTISYIRSDISLPNKPYTVKVVTERGNTAVYSGS